MEMTVSALDKLKNQEPFLWINPDKKPIEDVRTQIPFCLEDMLEAEKVLKSYEPVLQTLFPELAASGGIIESPLLKVESAAKKLYPSVSCLSPEQLFIKADHALPVSGSIKARGGIFAVLKIVDSIAVEEGFFNEDRRFSLSAHARNIFSSYTISVGSTGNLGLSIGIAGRAFGFKVSVHMSSDAKQWKKEKLSGLGADVRVYQADYSAACAHARKEAEYNPKIKFIDDENSPHLFLGYSVAALRLVSQLESLKRDVSNNNPLFVYLPCGVGGAPGGIIFGLKSLFGEAVHCFIAEPAAAPAMTLGLVTGMYSDISIGQIGLSGVTCADGLAVGRPSGFVSRIMGALLDGAFTVSEPDFYRYLALLFDSEGIKIEPSAAAGFAGIPLILPFLRNEKRGTHIIWTTGGSMEPDKEFTANYKRGKAGGM